MGNIANQRTIGFMEAVRRAFGNYCVFTGRASRSEYWWFSLLCTVVVLILGGPSMVKVISNPGADSVTAIFTDGGMSIALSIWTLITVLPSLGLTFRRLHDSGKSGWWILINLVPFVGGIILFIFMLLPSQPMSNKYGPIPNVD